MVGLMRLITISLALNQAAPDCPALAPSGTSSVPHSSGPIDTFRSKTQCNAKRATGRVKKVCTHCPNCPANCWNASNSTTTPKNCKPWPPARPSNSSNIWHTENTVIAQLILLLLRFIGQAPGFGAGQCRAFLSVEKLMLFGASGEHETRQQKLLYKTFANKKKTVSGTTFHHSTCSSGEMLLRWGCRLRTCAAYNNKKLCDKLLCNVKLGQLLKAQKPTPGFCSLIWG